MKRVLAITVPVIIFALMIGTLAGLALSGVIYITPQYKYYIVPAWITWRPGVPYPPATDKITNAQYPPVYAILHFYPNGSATAQAWIYDSNTVPIKVFGFAIEPTFIVKNNSIVWCNLLGLSPVNSSCPAAHLLNNHPVWWGLDGTPMNSSYPPGTPWGEVLPFTWAYTNDWAFVYINTTYGPRTLIPPGLLVGNGSDEYFAVYTEASSPLGFFNFYEPFVYVGNGTWVATPGTGYLHLYRGPFTYWQVWPEEVPPGWPYPNLVNITNAPLPPWWGKPSFPSYIPGAGNS